MHAPYITLHAEVINNGLMYMVYKTVATVNIRKEMTGKTGQF